MRRAREKISLAILLLAAIPILSATSQPTHISNNRQKPTQEQRGTEKSPVFVKVVTPEKSAAFLAKEEAKEQRGLGVEKRLAGLTGDLAEYTRYLAIGTAALALLTAGLLGLGVVQALDNNKTIRNTEISANAAKASADAVVSQLRAYVRIAPEAIRYEAADKPIMVLFSVRNAGQTPALECISFLKAAVMETGFDPGTVFNLVDDGIKGAQFTLYPGGDQGHTAPLYVTLSNDDLESMRNRAKNFYIYGSVIYRDAFENKRVTQFCAYLDGKDFEEARSASRASGGVPAKALFKFARNGNTAT